MLDLIGWIATAIFISSYFFRSPTTLRAVQVAGAIVWIWYGVLLKAQPVILANVLLVGIAVFSTLRQGRSAASAAPARESRSSGATAASD